MKGPSSGLLGIDIDGVIIINIHDTNVCFHILKVKYTFIVLILNIMNYKFDIPPVFLSSRKPQTNGI